MQDGYLKSLIIIITIIIGTVNACFKCCSIQFVFYLMLKTQVLSLTHFMYNLYQNQNHFHVLARDKSEYTKITGNPFVLQEYNLYYN